MSPLVRDGLGSLGRLIHSFRLISRLLSSPTARRTSRHISADSRERSCSPSFSGGGAVAHQTNPAPSSKSFCCAGSVIEISEKLPGELVEVTENVVVAKEVLV